MAEKYQTALLRSDPGIKKDETSTEGNNWNDGQWTRFYRGLPRSMLGYRSMTNAYPGPSRGLFVNLNGSGFLDIFSGSSDALTVGQFTTDGFGSGVTDITPSGFVANAANVWQMDSFYNANGGGEISLIAHAAPNLVNISSDIARSVYYGDITAAVPLVAATDDSMQPFGVSGGIVVLDPYVVAYGSKGLVAWSSINDPSTFPVANQANPTPTKIVKGLSVRGSAAPAALLWSLDSLLLMSFVGGDVVWTFATVSDQSSILSSSCPVEMDGIYYWIGVDRFLTYNGVLRELPNEMNLDFFFTDLNFDQRQKVFGYKIPHWGEIVWCYPSGISTECDAAIIYNVRENTWYNTKLPRDGRSAAYFAQSWQYPVLSGANPIVGSSGGAGTYQMWQSEYGRDEIIDNNVNAIESFVVSSDLCIVGGTLPPMSDTTRWTQLVGLEPDWDYGSSLSIDILTRTFAQDDNIIAQSNIITQGDNYFATQIQARYIRWKIGSNCQGGYFVTGNPLIRYREGDQNQ